MTTKPFEFEKALRELEDITAWFESSDADLDAGLVKFERGMELTTQLKDHLQSVENRVENIKARFGAAKPSAGPDVDAPTEPAAGDPADQTDLFGS